MTSDLQFKWNQIRSLNQTAKHRCHMSHEQTNLITWVSADPLLDVLLRKLEIWNLLKRQNCFHKADKNYVRHLCWKVFVFTWSILYIENLFNSHGKWTLVSNRFFFVLLKSSFCSLVNQCEECYKNPKTPITVPGYIILRFPLLWWPNASATNIFSETGTRI